MSGSCWVRLWLKRKPAVAHILNSESISNVPLIGVAVAAYRDWDSALDRSFAAKMEAFCSAFEKTTKEERACFEERIRSDGEDAKRAGDTLLLVIEKVTDFSKPKMLSAVFVAYLNSQISSAELRALAHAVDIAFLDNLKALAADAPFTPTDVWLGGLVPAGLVDEINEGGFTNKRPIRREISDLGEKFRKAMEGTQFRR